MLIECTIILIILVIVLWTLNNKIKIKSEIADMNLKSHHHCEKCGRAYNYYSRNVSYFYIGSKGYCLECSKLIKEEAVCQPKKN